MKSLLLTLLLLSCASNHGFGQTNSPPSRLIDTAAARIASPIITRLDSAWNTGDGVRFAAEFTNDSDVINVSGTHLHGRADIASQLQSIFSTVFKGSVHRSRTLEMARYLADSLIIVLSSSVIDVPTGPLAPQARSRQTFIVVNNGRIWQIQHWHNTPIRSR